MGLRGKAIATEVVSLILCVDRTAGTKVTNESCRTSLAAASSNPSSSNARAASAPNAARYTHSPAPGLAVPGQPINRATATWTARNRPRAVRTRSLFMAVLPLFQRPTPQRFCSAQCHQSHRIVNSSNGSKCSKS